MRMAVKIDDNKVQGHLFQTSPTRIRGAVRKTPTGSACVGSWNAMEEAEKGGGVDLVPGSPADLMGRRWAVRVRGFGRVEC